MINEKVSDGVRSAEPPLREHLRLLHVLVPGRVGGLESVVGSLAPAQERRGHDVRVVAFLPGDKDAHPLVTQLRSAGVEAEVCQTSPRGYWREYRYVTEACRVARPNVVHTHGYRADVVSGAAARRCGVSTVTTVHGFTGGGWRNRFYQRLQRWSHGRFAAVVAVSKTQVRNLVESGVEPDRIHVVRNAWTGGTDFLEPAEARRSLGLPSDVEGPLLGWVGRMSREKGVDVLLRALGRLETSEWQLVLVGEGREEDALRRLAERLGIEDRIHWAGYLPEAGRRFRAFDLFCLSSRTEGTPIVLLEAVAAGVPVVATDVGGVADVVGPDGAWLVPSERPERLAEAIRRALADEASSRERARSARRRLGDEFGAEAWVRRYDSVYRSAMARTDGTGGDRA